MSDATAQPTAPTHPIVAVDARHLPVFCPNPAMPLWSSHPRVFLHFDESGEARCPYCGTRYRLVGSPAGGGHH